MRTFLRETCLLWYWALFRPETLRRYINTSTPMGDWDGLRWEPARVNILFSRPNRRLLGQFALLIGLQLLPLSLVIALKGQPSDWLFVPAAVFGAYGISVFFRSLGLHFPLLLLLVYLINPEAPRQLMEVSQGRSPTPSVILLSDSVILGGLLISSLVSFRLTRCDLHQAARGILGAGFVLSIILAAWLASESWLVAVLCGGAVALFLLIIHSVLTSRVDDRAQDIVGITAFGISFGIVAGMVTLVMDTIIPTTATISSRYIPAAITVNIAFGIAVGVAFGLAGGITLGVAKVVASGFTRNVVVGIASGIAFGTGLEISSPIAGAIAGLTTLGMPLFLLASWFIGACLAPVRGRWHGLIAAGVLAVLGFESYSWNTLLVIPAVVLGYYRLLPEFLIFALISAVQTTLLRRGRRLASLDTLRVLPPHTSELLWLPLPGHHKLLAAAFRADPAEALETLQQMRMTRLPSFRHTIRRALPHIVANQLLAVASSTDLVAVVAPEHPLLPLLVPSLYQEPEPGDNHSLPSTAPPAEQREIAGVLSRLRAISHDIGAALSVGSPFLRGRSLDHCLTKLARLQDQLPGLALDVGTLPSWRAVLEHWHSIVQIEITQQRTSAQEEIINPFQSGNPLRADRAHLFKGRQSFADAIMHQVLERGRPTLVLHGPRRCGKSSFLLNLPRLLPGSILPVYLDLQNPAATASNADFCYSLARAIARSVKLSDVQFESPQRASFAAGPYAALEDWLDRALQPLDSRRLLLCLDEFEKLGGAVGQGTLDLALFDALHHLIQHRDEMSFLFCGVQTLNELGANWSSCFISVRPIEMTYLEPEEARAVLEDPDPRFDLHYVEGIVEEALRVTNRQPYLLQLVGEEMVKQANQHHTRTVTKPLLAGALQAALVAGEPYFTHVWSDCTGSNAGEVQAGRALLHALACDQPLILDGALTQAALRRLMRYHVLTRTETGYYFEVPLIARWIRERSSPT